MEKYMREHGMVYDGEEKCYIGKVAVNKNTGLPDHELNTFGYYLRTDGVWIAFVTDSERGIERDTIKCSSEQDALNKLYELAERKYCIHLSDSTVGHFDEKEPVITAYLRREYGYSEGKADKAIAYLKQNMFIAAEFVYYIEHGTFIPEKYAEEYSGYTAEKLSHRKDLTVLGAFNYMIYLQKDPTAALNDLQKGLPRK